MILISKATLGGARISCMNTHIQILRSHIYSVPITCQMCVTLDTGIRGQEPQSILAGIMWADMSSLSKRFDIRHVARDEDNLETYTWVRHDLRTFGRQELLDRGVLLQTSLLKSPSSGYGGDWSLRINASAPVGASHPRQCFLFQN